MWLLSEEVLVLSNAQEYPEIAIETSGLLAFYSTSEA
jgi:hypothetical protein